MLVVCHGMNRSGSTLQYNLVRRLVEELGVGVGSGSFEYREGEPHDGLMYALEHPTYHVIKMHYASREILELVKRGPAKVTYIHRDIRDVAASWKRIRVRTLEDMVTRLDNLLATYCTLQDLDDPDVILWQKYQTVVDDIPSATREIAQFLGIEADASLIAQVADEWSLEGARRITQGLRQAIDDRLAQLGPHSAEGQELRRQIRTKELSARDGVSQLHYNHISSTGGASGAWRSQLTEHEIEVLTDRYRWWLVDAGYIPA
jgi:hypothetical protein